ncbi:MAG: carboxypeptidase-like regulatory domain-containing protein [Pseudomonadota bacterium]|nr:carboxypeptidase-like regulatory domain-containing protein [Pseudomonadota bacterium]
MIKNYFVIKPILLLLMLGLSSLSLAAEEAAIAPPAGEEGVSQGVPYMTGGIGEEGREIITDKADEYNLKLIFAEKQDGQYLADVNVVITNAAGETVLETVSDGPWFYAQLPAGDYQVSATVNGRTVEKTVQAPAEGQNNFPLYWADTQE